MNETGWMKPGVGARRWSSGCCGCGNCASLPLLRLRDSSFGSAGPGLALPKFPVPRVFFQKIYDFRAEISCSQSFLLKDLWFRSSAFRPTGPGWFLKRLGPVGRNFLFPEFSFKRSVVSGPEFPVPRGRPYIRTDSGYGQ